MNLHLIKEIVLKQYHFNLLFAEKSVEDIPQELMSKSGGAGLENHPSFTLGHLATASAMTVEDLGGKCEIPGGWDELFVRKGPGDPRMPVPDESRYPQKEVLINELNKQHEKVVSMLSFATDQLLLNTIKWRFNRYFPSVLDLVTFMCISHESMHLSQLSAWRRKMGFDSALAKL
jgi:hypothetical protein